MQPCEYNHPIAPSSDEPSGQLIFFDPQHPLARQNGMVSLGGTCFRSSWGTGWARRSAFTTWMATRRTSSRATWPGRPGRSWPAGCTTARSKGCAPTAESPSWSALPTWRSARTARMPAAGCTAAVSRLSRTCCASWCGTCPPPRSPACMASPIRPSKSAAAAGHRQTAARLLGPYGGRQTGRSPLGKRGRR